MSRGNAPFKLRDLTKAVKGTVKGGLSVQRIEIENGKIIVFPGKPSDHSDASPAQNEWDSVK